MAARILVVEDDADLRTLLMRGLQAAGHVVTAVRDGAAAVALSPDPGDVVVLDIGLPDADGRDVCQALRARGVTAPVIFLTARDAAPDRISGFTAGGDDYPSPIPRGRPERRVLAALAAAPEQAARRSSLVAAAWPAGAIVHDNTLDVYVRRLRRKLERLPDAPAIATVRGVGYRLG